MKKRLLYILLASALAVIAITITGCTKNSAEVLASTGYSIDETAIVNYAIVRSDYAEGDLVQCGMDVRYALLDAGYELTLTTDFYREGYPDYEIREYEILVGDTNRPETAEFLDGLQMWQYGYALVGQKIVIAGHNDEATRLAVNAFNQTIASRTPFRFSEADNYVYGAVKEGEGKIYSLLTLNLGTGNVDDSKLSDATAIISQYSPEVILIQNAYGDTAENLTPRIQDAGYELGADYKSDTKHNLIYYNTNAYTYSSAGHIVMSQLSTLSDREKGSFTYCVLRSAETKQKYVFCATDLSGVQASEIQSRLEVFGNFAKNTSTLPIFFGGIFDGSSESPVCSNLTAYGFADCVRLSKESSGDCTDSYLYASYDKIAVAKAEAIENGVYIEFQRAK